VCHGDLIVVGGISSCGLEAPPLVMQQVTALPVYDLELNKQQLQLLKERFQAFLNGETQIVADEAFCNAVRSYYEEKPHQLVIHPKRLQPNRTNQIKQDKSSY
ncbi:hypothetical protein STEG23_009993, partial [Scotinomys teguina]